MQCATCGTINPAQARFCMGCGVSLINGLVCSQCHTLLPLEARYCYYCGTYQAAARLPSGAQPGATPPALATPAPVGTTARSSAAAAPAPGAPLPPPSSTKPEPEHIIGQLPAPQSLPDLLPWLGRYLPKDLYEPLEGVPSEGELQAACSHLSALLKTVKTYLPWPVVAAPQMPGIPAGGMRQGVFLFGDVSGFTPLSEKLKSLGQEGAEIITRLINALFTDLTQVLFDHGGALLKFGGDALLGLFPAENDAQMRAGALRAAQAAQAMQEVLKKEMYAQITVLGEVRSLQIKCGISAGPYFAAHIGTQPSPRKPNGTMAFVTTGGTVNLAEEAEGHAYPGEIVMTGAVCELLGEVVESGPVNKEPDEGYVRLVQAPPLSGSATGLGIAEPPAGETLAQITYLAERLNRLTPYLADELVARIVTNPGDARIVPENRPVTVMFANYKGAARLIEKMGYSEPELVTRHLNNYFVHMASIIERYEGALARMDQYAVGDRLVIFFGAPRAHEDDPVRAVTTALEMQQAVRENFSALRTANGVYRFEQRIGVNTGYLFAGNVGATDLRQEYTLMGDDINMAARLMSNAAWGEILISKRTQEQVQAYFDLEDKGELKVKGKEIRIPTWRVLGKRGVVGRTRGLEEGESPLTGRESQLDKLRQVGQDFLRTRRGQILALTGNSGLGKSRLLRELQTWLFTQEQAAQIHWIEGRAFSFSEQISYWMAAQIMALLLDSRPDASQDDLLYALSERCEALLGEGAMNATPYLAHMMGLELGEEWSFVKALDGRVRQKQTLRAAAQFFLAAAREKPLVIALDDLHWADEASLTLIEHLLSMADKAPLMFCLLFRPLTDKLCWQLRNQAAANYHHRFNEVALEPLEREASAKLLEKLLPGAVFEAGTRAELLDKAAGNPFYLEEVVRSLRESGAVERVSIEPVAWQVTDKAAEIKVPSTLHAAIAARIDRLAEDSRLALQMASVLGRQFRLGLFQSLAQAEQEVNFWLSQLEHGGLLRVEQAADELLYNFSDTLVQEVAYDSLLAQNRQQLHSRVGDILEKHLIQEAQQSGQAPEQVLLRNSELLAHHFSNSDDHERALKYLEMAAKRSRERYANQTAIENYLQIARLKQAAGDLAGQAGALYTAGVIAYEIGQYEAARQALQESMALYQSLNDSEKEAWSVMYVGMIDLKQANYPAALARHSQAMELAQARQDAFQEGIHLTNLARVTLRMGQYELALEQFQKSLEMKRRMNDQTGVGFAQFYCGLIGVYQEKYDEAESALHDAWEVWGALPNNERLTSFYHYGMGMLALGRRQYQAAQEHLEKALELGQKLELRAEIIDNLSALSQAKLGLGELQAALEASAQALKLLATQKDVEDVQQIYFNHFRVLKALNDPQATAYLQQAYDTMTERAQRLTGEEQRRIYLEQVKSNQEISAAQQQG